MEARRSTPRRTRWLPVLGIAGLFWAFIQLVWTIAAAPTARGHRLTQCGQDLDYGLLVALTAGVVVLALATLALALARRPRLALAAVGAQALLAVVWWTADSAGGGVGCIIR